MEGRTLNLRPAPSQDYVNSVYLSVAPGADEFLQPMRGRSSGNYFRMKGNFFEALFRYSNKLKGALVKFQSSLCAHNIHITQILYGAIFEFVWCKSGRASPLPLLLRFIGVNEICGKLSFTTDHHFVLTYFTSRRLFCQFK